MGREAYRLRTNQTISDILKSVTKEKSTIISEKSGSLNFVIDDTEIESFGKIHSSVYEIPAGGVELYINKRLNMIQENSYISDNILYGDYIAPQIVSKSNLSINGTTVNPLGLIEDGGVTLSVALPDYVNPYVGVESEKVDRYKTIGDLNKNIILSSLKNTRITKQKNFTTLTFGDSDFLVLLINGTLVSSDNYIKNSPTEIEFKYPIPIDVDVVAFTSTSNFEIYPFNSFISETIGITSGSFIVHRFSSISVIKKRDGLYKIQYLGSNLFSSNLKIGSSTFVLLYDSTYKLMSGPEISSGNYTTCKEYAKVCGKYNQHYLLFGSLEFRTGKKYLVEGIM